TFLLKGGPQALAFERGLPFGPFAPFSGFTGFFAGLTALADFGAGFTEIDFDPLSLVAASGPSASSDANEPPLAASVRISAAGSQNAWSVSGFFAKRRMLASTENSPTASA